MDAVTEKALGAALLRAYEENDAARRSIGGLVERAHLLDAKVKQHDAEKANLRLELQAEMDSLRKSNARLLEERDDLRVELAQAIKLAEEKSATIDELGQALEQTRGETVDDLRRTIKHHAERIQDLKESRDILSIEADRLRDDLATAAGEIIALKKENDALKAQQNKCTVEGCHNQRTIFNHFCSTHGG